MAIIKTKYGDYAKDNKIEKDLERSLSMITHYEELMPRFTSARIGKYNDEILLTTKGSN